MDALNRIVAVPAWAYDFCWFYFAVAIMILVNSTWALWRLFSLPSLVKKVIPTTSVTIAIVLSGAFSIVLSMMQFWICRSSLAPTKRESFADLRKKGMMSGVAEKFAVACANDADCTAVMGTQPADSLCSCGGRGFCGGCVMNNNMEPATDGLAPIETFASMSPQIRKVGMTKPSKMPMRR
jgi:hypothetical protein